MASSDERGGSVAVETDATAAVEAESSSDLYLSQLSRA